MVILLAITTFFSTSIGGLVALKARDRLHLVLGLAAGVMLGLVAFDLVPEVFRLTSSTIWHTPTGMLTFAAGFLVIHVVERSVAIHHAHEGEWGDHHHPTVGLTATGALVVHSFIDGVGIGLAFQVSNQVGAAVAVAVITHDFADGLNTVSVMRSHGNNRKRQMLMLLADAAAPVLGAASTLFFTLPEHVLGLYLGFFAGFLLYLATGDILPEAHARHPSRLTLVATLTGVLLMWFVVAMSS